MRRVALEEAFWIDGLSTTGSFAEHQLSFKPSSMEKFARLLPDFTEYRLPEMDRYGIDVQVLSLTTPGIQAQPDPEVAVADARRANDFLADVIAHHPDRFAGFAALPLQDPQAAAAELQRAVTHLGFCGALVNDHTRPNYLDQDHYNIVWSTLQDLDVPLYLHPGEITADSIPLLHGRPELIGPTFSWAPTTAGHALRIVYGGVFDRYPRAKLVLGHMGEFLPFQLARLDTRYHDTNMSTPLQHLPSAYFGTNIKITTTGVHSTTAAIAAIQTIGLDNIMFSIDYPYESTAEAVDFLDAIPLTTDDAARLAHRNADDLLQLP